MAKPTYHGEPCKYCHGCLRYSGGHCVECTRKRAQEQHRRGYRSPVNLHPLYPRWCTIKQRCHNPKNPDYKYYGARGISMYDRWRQSFWAFVADIIAEIGPPPSLKHEIDRIDPNRNYEPSNIRWASRTTQNRNNRRVHLTIADAQLIRQLYRRGDKFHPSNALELAARFGVQRARIYQVAHGRSWKEE